MTRAGLTLLLALIATSASAQNATRHPPQPVVADPAQFKLSDIVEYWADIAARARAAQYCGLRSERWLRIMLNGVGNRIREDYRTLAGQSPFPVEYDAYGVKIEDWLEKAENPGFQDSAKCEAMVNSSGMDQLDGIVSRLTGGYR